MQRVLGDVLPARPIFLMNRGVLVETGILQHHCSAFLPSSNFCGTSGGA